VPTATIPAVGTAMSSRDHDHAHTQPARAPAPITNGNAAPITNEAVAQHLPAIVGEPADSLLDHLADEHGIGGDTGRWLLHTQGVSGLVKEHDLDHAENPGEQLGHTHPTAW
jgi:hypothetical protein